MWPSILAVLIQNHSNSKSKNQQIPEPYLRNRKDPLKQTKSELITVINQNVKLSTSVRDNKHLKNYTQDISQAHYICFPLWTAVCTSNIERSLNVTWQYHSKKLPYTPDPVAQASRAHIQTHNRIL